MYKFLIPLFALALLIGCSRATPPADQPGSSDSSVSSSDAAMSESSSADAMIKLSNGDTVMTGKHVVVLKTSMGDITVQVDADKAPRAATNFVTLSKSGYYSNLTFHRTIPNFMIQGGDPNGNGTGGDSIYTNANGEKMFNDEIPAKNPDGTSSWPIVRGSVVMANRGPNTNGSQFFIVQADATPWLDGTFTIFGQVTSGMDVVDKIANVPVVNRIPRDPQADRPVTPVTFNAEVQE